MLGCVSVIFLIKMAAIHFHNFTNLDIVRWLTYGPTWGIFNGQASPHTTFIVGFTKMINQCVFLWTKKTFNRRKVEERQRKVLHLSLKFWANATITPTLTQCWTTLETWSNIALALGRCFIFCWLWCTFSLFNGFFFKRLFGLWPL